MAVTVTVTQVTNPAKVGSPAYFTAEVVNDATSRRLMSLRVSETTRGGSQISQPTFRAPNSGVDDYPTLGASSTTQYGFSVAFTVPPTPGANPNNEPGGASPRNPAFPVYPLMQMRIDGHTSDGEAFFQFFAVAVITGVVMPPPEEGAANFGQGGNSNIIAVIM